MIGLGSTDMRKTVKADFAARSIIGTQKDVAIWLRSNRSIVLQKSRAGVDLLFRPRSKTHDLLPGGLHEH
jgi:hypothetical protein